MPAWTQIRYPRLAGIAYFLSGKVQRAVNKRHRVTGHDMVSSQVAADPLTAQNFPSPNIVLTSLAARRLLPHRCSPAG